MSGKLASDIQLLNSKIQYILEVFKDNPVMLDLSFDRLSILFELKDSVLLNPRIHPSVKYE